MEELQTLRVKIGERDEVEIGVFDIFHSDKFNKDFIAYVVDIDDENVYISILEEDDDSYELKAITNKEEEEFAHQKMLEYEEKFKERSEE